MIGVSSYDAKSNSRDPVDKYRETPAKVQPGINGVDDAGYSDKLLAQKIDTTSLKVNQNDMTLSYIKSTINMPNNEDIYNKTYRFGHFLKDTISVGREFLFFTKPELYIMQRDGDLSSGMFTGAITPGLENEPFWEELVEHRQQLISLLQRTYGGTDPFNHLLQNTVNSNLDIPSLSAEYVDSASNSYGVNMSYRSSSEASDDSPEFSLEFKDNKWLDVFYYFKAYDEYEVRKHHGLVGPYIDYIVNKRLHDQIAIFKFVVDDDMETILYYGKMYGVTPKNVPREVFSSPNWDSGITYSIDFKASFYEEMKPDIIADFNALSKDWYSSQKYRVDVYNDIIQAVDHRPTTAAYIDKVATDRSPMGFVYKLRWKGSDDI